LDISKNGPPWKTKGLSVPPWRYFDTCIMSDVEITPPAAMTPAMARRSAELYKAAAGGDVADVAVALRIALSIEGVECRPS
jgi:hypothetical protein